MAKSRNVHKIGGSIIGVEMVCNNNASPESNHNTSPIIAVIDSGIDADYYRTRRDKFIKILHFNLNGKAYYPECPADDNGHGTMCVDLISQICPSAKYYILRILDKEKLGSTLSLLSALDYLHEVDVDIIHMSISVIKRDSNCKRIFSICSSLREQGKVLICSVANGYKSSFPACLNCVLGVQGGMFDYKYGYSYRRGSSRILCDATPIMVTGKENKLEFFSSNSKAASVATGMIAESFKQATNDRQSISEFLKKQHYRNLKYYTWSKSEPPVINNLQPVNYNNYKWEATKVIEDICYLFGTTRVKLETLPYYSACEYISADRFVQLFDWINKRERLNISPHGMGYSDFEWLYSLLNYIDGLIGRGNNE